MDYVLDPELAAVAAYVPVVDPDDIIGARKMVEKLISSAPPYESQVPLSVQDVTVTGSDAEIPVRIHAPVDRPASLPGLIFIHTGGYTVGGGLALSDTSAKMIADRTGVIVVVVDYRLAPEHPYPAGLNDCYAVLEWVAAHGAEYGIDPDRLAVLGESSGAGLAAALTMLSRDRQGPPLVAQFLDAPMINDRCDTTSMKTMVDAPAWKPKPFQGGWDHYLKDIGGPGRWDVPVYAAPARATVDDLTGLPPAFVVAYEIDPLRDDALDYARLLTEAGVPTEIHQYSSAFHGAHVIPGTKIGARMLADRMDAIRRFLPV